MLEAGHIDKARAFFSFAGPNRFSTQRENNNTLPNFCKSQESHSLTISLTLSLSLSLSLCLRLCLCLSLSLSLSLSVSLSLSLLNSPPPTHTHTGTCMQSYHHHQKSSKSGLFSQGNLHLTFRTTMVSGLLISKAMG